MKTTLLAILVIFLILPDNPQAQINYKTEAFNSLDNSKPSSLSNTDYLERVGEWPYGPSETVAVDSVRDLIFLGSGGGLLILDGSDKANPELITDTIRTAGLVEDIFYDVNTERLYIACGEGGYEIWNVEDPFHPFLYSINEIYYYDVETPVGHVQVRGDFAVFECAWGYIQSVNVSDPYNPFQVSFNGLVGNPAHNIHIDQSGYVHATGYDYYIILSIDGSGSLHSVGGLPIQNCYAVFGGTQASYVGQGDYLWIVYSGGYHTTDVGGITDITVRGNLAYITNEAGLNIWDVTDNNNPFQISNTSTETYLRDICLAGNYAYISAGAKGVIIFDISDPSSPVEVGSYNSYSEARASVVQNDIAYIAHSGDGLLMVDISNPDYPELIGQFVTGSYNYDVRLKNSLAYLACWEAGFKIVDVSDPASPFEISSIENFNASRLELGSNYVYIVESYPPGTSFNIKIIDISNPENPVEVSSTPFDGRVSKMAYLNEYLFVADDYSGVRILDVSDPQNPLQVHLIPLQYAEDVYIRNNLLFVCSILENGGLHVYDITDPEMPQEVYYYGGGFFDAAAVDDYWYISDGDDILLFYLEGSDPVYIDQYRLPYLVFGLEALDKYIYVTDGSAGFSIYKNNLIENPPELNWQFQNSEITEEIWDIDMLNQNKGFAAAQHGIILKTANGGSQWETLQVGTYSDDFYSLNFGDDLNGWAGTESGIVFHTTDGGDTWYDPGVPLSGAVMNIDFVNGSTGWMVTRENHYLLKTTDGGQGWVNQNSGLTEPYRYFDVNFVDENTGYVAGAMTPSFPWTYFLIKTTDGGSTWSTKFSSQDLNVSVIYFIDQNVGFFGGYPGVLLKTTDGGNTWNQKNVNSDVSISNLCFVNNNYGWFTGSDGALFRTTDAGETWTENDLLIQNYLRAIDFVDEQNGWLVGNDGIILRSGDGVVPVELSLFTASVNGNEIILKWTTAAETNNKGFDVQRKKSGAGSQQSEWKSIGFIEGNGTTTERHSYSFVDKEITDGKYYYRLKQVDFNGSYEYSREVEAEAGVPAKYLLEQNYPNPFNPATTIEYSIPKAGKVSIKVFNILGEEVINLVNEFKDAGNYKVNFNAGRLSSGIYYYRLSADSYSYVKKMIVLK